MSVIEAAGILNRSNRSINFVLQCQTPNTRVGLAGARTGCHPTQLQLANSNTSDTMLERGNVVLLLLLLLCRPPPPLYYEIEGTGQLW